MRRQYDPAFKADAVRLVTEGGYRPTDVAREVDITPKMLSQWRRQLEKHTTPQHAFVGHGHGREAEVTELKRRIMKRRITILEMERDILTGAATAGSGNSRERPLLLHIRAAYRRGRCYLGWVLSETLEATLVASAWNRALHTRGFASHQGPELYHRDRGSQYASDLFQDLLERCGTQASMSRKGRVPSGPGFG